MSAMDTQSPKLVSERNARLDALGPRPPWWRPFTRRRWDRDHARISAVDVSEWAEMLRHWYGPESVKRLAAQPPMFGTMRKP